VTQLYKQWSLLNIFAHPNDFHGEVKMVAALFFPLISLAPQHLEVLAEMVEITTYADIFIGLLGSAINGNVEETEAGMEDLINYPLGEKEAVGVKACAHVGMIPDNFEDPVNMWVEQGLSIIARNELLCIGE